ncbi:oligosaccharide repeat unit polymerase [Serratia sp. D1N4]
MKKTFLNPMYLFGFSFLLAIFLYEAQLSGLYKNGSRLITIVMVFICIVSIVIGFFFNGMFNGKSIRNREEFDRDKIMWPNALFVVIGFAIECAASGLIPLLVVIQGYNYEYRDFGIKTFHVFYMSYTSAFSIICFNRYLDSKNKKLLIYAMLGVLVSILIVSRGATMLLVLPMTLMYFAKRNSSRKVKLKSKIAIIVFFISGIILFGFLGDKRMVASGYTSEDAIMDIGIANDAFRRAPSGFFWVYLYASSPYGTLAAQERFDNVNKGTIKDFVIGSIIPDFISKHLQEEGSIGFQPKRLTPELTVGSGFSVAIATFGFAGITLLFLWMVFLSFLFAWLNKNKYMVEICAILSSSAALMVFDNMFIFSSCVMQLVIITIFSRVRIGNYHFI